MPAIIIQPKGGYFVWTKRGKAPRFHHDTLDSAQTEANRLAALHPGAKFIVMQGVTKHSKPVASSAGVERGEAATGSPSPQVSEAA